MKASEIINLVAVNLQDTDNETWTRAQLLDNLNDALRTLPGIKPDVSSTVKTWQLTADTVKQSLPTNDLRLLGHLRNMGADGNTPGNALRGPVDHDTKDAYEPGWPAVIGVTSIEEWLYDERTPTIFYVSPRPHATTAVYVEAAVSAPLTLMTLETDTIPVRDEHIATLQEWMKFKAFDRDSEVTPNAIRAVKAFKAFFNLNQVKMQVDISMSPNTREMLERQTA